MSHLCKTVWSSLGRHSQFSPSVLRSSRPICSGSCLKLGFARALFLGRACSSAVQQGLVTDVQPQKYLLWDQTVFVLLKRYISWCQCSQYFKHILDFNRGNSRCECTDISKFMQGALHLQRMVSLSGHLFKISSTKYVFQPIEPSNHVHNGNCHSVLLSSPLMLMLICFTSDLCCRWCWSWRWRWCWCRWWRWRCPDRSSTALAAQRKDIGGVWRGLEVGWTCSTWWWWYIYYDACVFVCHEKWAHPPGSLL